MKAVPNLKISCSSTQRRLDSQTVAVTFSRTFDFSISEEFKHIENKKY